MTPHQERMMAEETFWVVQEKGIRRWTYAVGSFRSTKRDAIRAYGHPNWEGCRRAGNVRCIKVRIVAVERSEIPRSGGG